MFVFVKIKNNDVFNPPFGKEDDTMPLSRLSRILLLLTLAVGMILSCASCRAAENSWSPAGFKLASSDVVDYKLWVPEDWTVDLSTGVTSAYYSKTDRSNVTLVAFSLSGRNDIPTPSDEDTRSDAVKKFWDGYSADLLQTFPDLTYADDAAADGTRIVMDSVSARKFVYTATVTGTKYQFMQTITVHNDYVYIFTYTAIPEVYESHVEDVNNILRYFSFDGSTMGENSMIS